MSEIMDMQISELKEYIEKIKDFNVNTDDVNNFIKLCKEFEIQFATSDSEMKHKYQEYLDFFSNELFELRKKILLEKNNNRVHYNNIELLEKSLGQLIEAEKTGITGDF